ncbi:zinc protease [Azospira sp. I13]|uniref:M16 family metallopeptidase n=1 Tax=Azospira sp. I13 TaxID=1765050 RepID=UPI000D4C1013|nr:pitrilysin family protein [Azospira sp. I13]GBG03419.1 zinc protease [Azospira sp. I13]
MFPRKLRALPLLLLGLLSASAALANPFETTLKNGLKVIVKEDRRAPTAVHMVWYKVGSMDEVDGTSGLAHALEHMMFKGTPKVGPGEFNRRVAAAGGRDNAFTNYDYTAYFQQIPKQKLPEMMALEADRMGHLTLDPKEFAKEIRVIMEERRMRTDDNPQSLLFEALNAAAYQAHPYRRPVIGWMADLEQMTATDLRDWYRRWYVPNNATLVVVGDVDHQAVFREAEKTYGKLKFRAIEARKPIAEAPQKGIRRITVKGPAELPQVLLAWKAPVLRDVNKDSDPYALEMLGAVLDGHDAARLTRSLVKEQRLAQGVGSAYDTTSRGPSLFYLMATPAEGHTPAELEAALKAEVARIAAEGVSDEELQRARAQLVASQVYKRDSMFAQAMEIGQMEIVGLSYRAVDTMIDKLKAVTAADVQRVARQYFNDDSLTVGLLEPQPLDEAPRRRAAAGARH